MRAHAASSQLAICDTPFAFVDVDDGGGGSGSGGGGGGSGGDCGDCGFDALASHASGDDKQRERRPRERRRRQRGGEARKCAPTRTSTWLIVFASSPTPRILYLATFR